MVLQQSQGTFGLVIIFQYAIVVSCALIFRHLGMMLTVYYQIISFENHFDEALGPFPIIARAATKGCHQVNGRSQQPVHCQEHSSQGGSSSGPLEETLAAKQAQLRLEVPGSPGGSNGRSQQHVDAQLDATCTFGELLDASRRVAAGLRRLGLRAGDVVAFHGPNSLELVFAMCGTFFAGGIGLLSKRSLTRENDTCSNPSPDTTLLIAYSSGTTGLPKGVQLTHRNLIAQVVDFDTRETLGPNQQGEVCVKSPAAFKAYLNQPKLTADAYEDGFVRTGDRGYYTADGCLFLSGRFKELIKCMDQQVPPAELEELLAADPAVKHVIVVGIPHPQYGEAARAFVVHRCRPADPLEEQREAERLKQLVAGRLAHHKHLHGGLEFLDSIPQNNNGKYLRNSVKMAYIERCQSGKNSGI
nr:uncharacterized protein LOC126516446 [Dermacentor andersoni]